MKWIAISIISLFLLVACQEQASQDNELVASELIMNPNTGDSSNTAEKILPILEFEHKDFDFGLIYQGEKVVHKYKFKNTGNANLIISDVSASCGCTVPTYSKKPIKPGEEGYVEVEFDSSGRQGQQHKSVTVLANTQPNRVELSFIAEIEVNN